MKFLLVALTLTVFLFFAMSMSTISVGSQSGVGPGCNCSNVACDCCDDTPPPLSTSICLDSQWNVAQQTIEVKAIFGGLPLGDITFSKSHQSQCLSIFGGSMCVQVQNLSIVSTGSCGCFFIDIDFFGVKIEVPIGCFNYGYGSSCPDTCGNHATCEDCDKGINCGWCNSTQSCMSGDQNGAYPPGNCTVTEWLYHEDSCTQNLPVIFQQTKDQKSKLNKFVMN